MHTCAKDFKDSFSLHIVDEQEIVDSIPVIRSTANGLDDIGLKFIIIILPLSLHFILHIINTINIISTSSYPVVWKRA